METVKLSQGQEFHTSEQPSELLLNKAIHFATSGDINAMMATLDDMPLQEIVNKENIFRVGLMLIESLALGQATDDQQINGYRRLNAYFNDSDNTISTILLHVRLLESTIDDVIVQDYINSISDVLSYNTIFHSLMDDDVRYVTLARFDTMMKTSGPNYAELAQQYKDVRYSDKYQLILNNISRLYVMDTPSYLIPPDTEINHYNEVEKLLEARVINDYIGDELINSSLDLLKIGRLVARLDVDNNLLFIMEGQELGGRGTTDKDCKTLAAINKFLVMDPYKRREVCERIGVKYSTEEDIDEFRVFGPCNPIGYESYDIVQQRMFTSYAHNNINESGEEYYNDEEITVAELKNVIGFNHTCAGCGIRIPELHYGVRIPLPPPIGGWSVEVYHDWDCAYDHTDDIMSQTLISIFKIQTDLIGIFNRIYYNEYEIEENPPEFEVRQLLKNLYEESDEEEEEEDEDPDAEYNNWMATESIRQTMELAGLKVLDDSVENIIESLEEATENEEFLRMFTGQLEEAYSRLDANHSTILPPLNQFVSPLPIELGGDLEMSNYDLSQLQMSVCDDVDL